MTDLACGSSTSGTPESANIDPEGQSDVGCDTLPPLPCPFKHSVSLQKLGTVGRRRGPLIYISAARRTNHLTPKGGALGPDKAHIVLTKWGGEIEGNGGKKYVQGYDFTEWSCSGHGIHRDPWPDWLLGEMQIGGQCWIKGKKLKDAFKTKSRSNHLRWGKMLLPQVCRLSGSPQTGKPLDKRKIAPHLPAGCSRFEGKLTGLILLWMHHQPGSDSHSLARIIASWQQAVCP